MTGSGRRISPAGSRRRDPRRPSLSLILFRNSAARASRAMKGTRSREIAASLARSLFRATERLSLTSSTAVPDRPYWVKRTSPSAVSTVSPPMIGVRPRPDFLPLEEMTHPVFDEKRDGAWDRRDDPVPDFFRQGEPASVRAEGRIGFSAGRQDERSGADFTPIRGGRANDSPSVRIPAASKPVSTAIPSLLISISRTLRTDEA